VGETVKMPFGILALRLILAAQTSFAPLSILAVTSLFFFLVRRRLVKAFLPKKKEEEECHQ